MSTGSADTSPVTAKARRQLAHIGPQAATLIRDTYMGQQNLSVAYAQLSAAHAGLLNQHAELAVRVDHQQTRVDDANRARLELSRTLTRDRDDALAREKELLGDLAALNQRLAVIEQSWLERFLEWWRNRVPARAGLAA